jgi:hypothetical protein
LKEVLDKVKSLSTPYCEERFHYLENYLENYLPVVEENQIEFPVVVSKPYYY